MKLSIVTTLYQSAPYMEEFWRRASSAARRVAGDEYELIMVNDGSPDESLERAVQLTERDPHVVVVDLSRNFGHHRALMTGMAHARGERVFIIDADLEEDPEWLAGYAEQMEQDGCDVIYGVQRTRKGGWFERVSGRVFYRLFQWLTGLDLPANNVMATLMTRRYVDALLQHEEREVYLGGLMRLTGFEQRVRLVEKRDKGATAYTLRRRVSLFVNSVTSFSNLPLVGVFVLGILICFVTAAYSVYLVIRWVFLADPLAGWTSVMVSIWLLGGTIMTSIGLIGIYLAKVYSETKRRPYTIVRAIYGSSSGACGEGQVDRGATPSRMMR